MEKEGMNPHNHCQRRDHSHLQEMPSKHHLHRESGTHNKHAGHSIEMFRDRFFVSLILTIPVLALSPMIQKIFGFSFGFAGDRYLLFVISSIVFFYGGWPFLIGAISEIRNQAIGMMTLISLAIAVAYLYSSSVIFGLTGKMFFWELVTLIDIMLLGHWIEMRAVMGASMALEKLSALIPDYAHLLENDEVRDIATSELKDGDIILVKPGEKIPADGIVVDGSSFVNESMLTGEARPIAKAEGDKVIGGSINEDGLLKIRITTVREGSYLSKVIELVKQAQASKSKTQALADKAAFWLTIVAISVGAITFVSWIITGHELAFAIERTATVLVIACPHALGLAIPLVVAISTTLSAQNGLLVRNRTAFENARKITTVVFDKTGTLTEGAFVLRRVYPLNDEYSEDEILRLSAALDRNSEHPIAKAIVKEAEERKIALPEVHSFRVIRGKGVEGYIEDKKVLLASSAYIKELGIEAPLGLQDVEGTVVF